MHALHEEALTALAATFRAELKEDNETTRRYMLVLNEQVIERIKTIGQG